MDLSIFDVVGPVMIGPSSSHTAGAARLAFVARQIAGEFTRVSFGLHGSFARTYRGRRMSGCAPRLTLQRNAGCNTTFTSRNCPMHTKTASK